MVKFSTVMISLILIGLIAVLVISAGIQMASDYGFDTSIANDSRIGNIKIDLSDAINEAYEDERGASDSLSNSTITTSAGIPFIDAIGGVWKSIKNGPTVIFNLIKGLGESVLGSSYALVFTALGAIISIIVIFAIWRMIATGDG